MKKKTLCVIMAMWFLHPVLSNAAKSNEIEIDQLKVVAANDPPVDDVPMGQSGGDSSLLPEGEALITDSDDLFGSENRMIHPVLTLEWAYTDNLFASTSNEQSSSIFRISPGVWFSLPRKKEQPVLINVHNASPSGLQYEIDEYGGMDRWQLYGKVGADLYMYSEDSDLNAEDFYIEGLGRYNMASGLSLQLMDKVMLGHDRFGEGAATPANLREYTSNLFKATADWDVTEKLRLRIDYTNFTLSYDSSVNNVYDRVDNGIDLFGYFNVTEKTAFFLQYGYIDVDYDVNSAANNSQDYWYAGVKWDTTEKLSLHLKGGIQDKEFKTESPGYENSDSFAVDFQAHYRMTVKTDIILNFYNKIEESDNDLASEKVVFGLNFAYDQEVREKINFRFDFIYENADYSLLNLSNRDDDWYYVRPSLRYFFKEWLMAEAAYIYEKRDSNDNTYDYDGNTVLFSINANW